MSALLSLLPLPMSPALVGDTRTYSFEHAVLGPNGRIAVAATVPRLCSPSPAIAPEWELHLAANATIAGRVVQFSERVRVTLADLEAAGIDLPASGFTTTEELAVVQIVALRMFHTALLAKNPQLAPPPVDHYFAPPVVFDFGPGEPF